MTSTTTLRYCIEQISDDCFRVTEADGPNAPATGEYPTLDAAQSAVQAEANRDGISDLDWDTGVDLNDEVQYWAAGWDRTDKETIETEYVTDKHGYMAPRYKRTEAR